MASDSNAPLAMAFYHPHGLVAAWKQASMFAGPGGRVASLPDVVEARIASPRGGEAWRSYFTTSSAEYYGLSRGGVPVLAVLHGTGPLSTVEGCLAAYAKDAEGRRRHGRVTRETFLAVLDGRHGDVHVVDWPEWAAGGDRVDRYLDGRRLPEDAWACARLGGRDLAGRYAEAHARIERARLDEEGREVADVAGRAQMKNECSGSSPYLEWSFAGRTATASARMPDDASVAHANLLSIGGMFVTSRFESADRHGELTFDVSTHDWTDGTRMAGMRPGPAGPIHPGVNIEAAYRERTDELTVPCEAEAGFDVVIERAGSLWTSYPKNGVSMDSGEPMHRVTSVEELGGPVLFETEPSGYYGFFRYAVADVRRLAPGGANAYRIVSGPDYDGSRDVQHAGIQFLRIEAERDRRLLRRDEIYRNDALVIGLATGRAA